MDDLVLIRTCKSESHILRGEDESMCPGKCAETTFNTFIIHYHSFISGHFSCIPGDEHSCVHWWDVVPSTGNVVGAEVPWAPKLLILPLTEALQRPLSLMANL